MWMCAANELTQVTPTTKTPTTTNGPGRFDRLIRQDCFEDPKRLAVVVGCVSLALGFLVVAFPAACWLWKHGDLGGGAVAALIATAGPLGAMVYGVHRKPDDVLPGGPDA